VKKINEDAKIPEYAHSDDAGMDLFAAQDTTVPKNGHVMVPTGLAFEIPAGYVGLIWPKSGLAVNHGIVTLAGVLDSGYRGELAVVIASTKDEEYTFKKGEKVAQMLIQKVDQSAIRIVSELSETTRGEGGFGSTGK